MDDKQRDETIPGAAVEEFEAIRLRGEWNMFDRLGVMDKVREVAFLPETTK